MTLFKNKYRVESSRLKGWNYSSPGYYFITICTKNRECLFGKIIDGKMVLSEMGKIANQHWAEIPNHFNNIVLDEFVIMPNHAHGIIIPVETPNLGVSTGNERDTENLPRYKKNANIGIIINQYKRICTINIRKINPDFAWQSRFYDRIIRDENELYNVRQYIINNPIKWEMDENNPVGVKMVLKSVSTETSPKTGYPI